MATPIDVISDDTRIMLQYEGLYLSLEKLDGVFKPVFFSDPNNESSIIDLGVKVNGDGIDQASFQLFTNRAYSNTKDQYLVYDNSMESYFFSESSKSGVELTLRQGHLPNTYSLYDNTHGQHLSVEPGVDPRPIVGSSKVPPDGFEIDILDNPNIIGLLDNDIVYVSPKPDNISHWLTGSFMRDNIKYSPVSGFHGHRATELDFGNEPKTVFFHLIDNHENNSPSSDWIFSNVDIAPTNTITLGIFTPLNGITLAGHNENTSITTEFRDPNNNSNSKWLKLTVNGNTPPGNASYRFVFRATHNILGESITYVSKDPTATQREPS